MFTFDNYLAMQLPVASDKRQVRVWKAMQSYVTMEVVWVRDNA